MLFLSLATFGLVVTLLSYVVFACGFFLFRGVTQWVR